MHAVPTSRLRRLRQYFELTQKQVAMRIGVSARAYSHYENGTRTIPPDILIALAELFGVTTDYLLCLTDVPGDHLFGDHTLLRMFLGEPSAKDPDAPRQTLTFPEHQKPLRRVAESARHLSDRPPFR